LLNAIFIFLVASSVLLAAWNGGMEALNEAWTGAARGAVTLAIGLIGFMALWLGLMRVLREAGAMAAIGRALAPIMRRLFPDIPPEHPAMSAMIMNLAANMLGMGNAATPFGLKAMRELDTLNTRPGVATDAMVLFLAMNTSGVAVLPLGVIAIRAQLGSVNDAAIIAPSILATACSTLVAILIARRLARLRTYAVDRYELAPDEAEETRGASIQGIGEAQAIAEAVPVRDPRRSRVLQLLSLALLGIMVLTLAGRGWSWLGMKENLGSWLMPALMGWIVVYGWSRRIDVYDAVVKGGREGFEIAIMIIPFLVAILVAVAMFRAAGGMNALTALVSPLTSLIGFPAEALPMAIIRPLSGSGAMGVMTATMEAHGPDSFVGYLVSVMNGSTETTFYVLALYLGSVRVRVARHAIWTCLAADLTGALAALFWCRVFF
jgi:spore maturation protein SpmA